MREIPVDIPSGVDEDLYALAVTVVMLLTGKDIQDLFNSQTQTWDWEKWKLVSDQLSEVLNRMLAVQPTNRFESANAVLQALNSSPIPPPPPPYLSFTPQKLHLNQLGHPLSHLQKFINLITISLSSPSKLIRHPQVSRIGRKQ